MQTITSGASMTSAERNSHAHRTDSCCRSCFRRKRVSWTIAHLRPRAAQVFYHLQSVNRSSQQKRRRATAQPLEPLVFLGLDALPWESPTAGSHRPASNLTERCVISGVHRPDSRKDVRVGVCWVQRCRSQSGKKAPRERRVVSRE